MKPMTKKSKSDTNSPAVLAQKHQRNLALGKARYKQSDAAMEEFLATLPRCETCGSIIVPTEPVILPTGKKVILEDKLSDKQSIPTGQSARRFSFKELTKP